MPALCALEVNGYMDKRWGISIDIEGFSNLYENSEATQTKAIWGLHQLMDAVIKVGQKVYPGDPNKNYWDRIFAHQFGDGFILISNFEEPDPSRCIAIAVSLSRHMLLQGFATKAAISTGGMSDINGCYPDAMRNATNNICTSDDAMFGIKRKMSKYIPGENGITDSLQTLLANWSEFKSQKQFRDILHYKLPDREII
jgi:hypothetical protein